MSTYKIDNIIINSSRSVRSYVKSRKQIGIIVKLEI